MNVTKTGEYVDSDWGVKGTITVFNPAAIPAEITGVSDTVSGVGTASVSCGVTFPYTLAAGQSLNCTYDRSLPNADERTNTATATLQNYDYNPAGVGTASGTTDFSRAAVAVSFAAPAITDVNASITVSDTNGGEWNFSDSGSVSYSETFFCSEDEGNHHNIATIEETGQQASADVDVTCYELTVAKTVETAFNRYWTWEIDKSADASELLLSAGQLYLVNYDVLVDTLSYTDADFNVSGTIKVTNPAPMDASLNSVTDDMTGYPGITVDCPAMTVPAGDSLTCTYSQDVSDASTRVNTATAVQQNFSYDSSMVASPAGTTSYSDSKDVIFDSTPADQIDECVDVYDDNLAAPGYLGTVCADQAPTTFSYSLWFGLHPDAEVQLLCGYNEHLNTAMFETNDTQTTGDDTWIVNADVACDYGCTLTPGYWKTHSSYGPAPYDNTWDLLLFDEETPFFLSGQTYYEVLWTNPKGGNAYYILAHAYIAAELNVLNGASMPDNVLKAFEDAAELFTHWAPETVASLKGKAGKEVRADFILLATILDDYNNGFYGPGHCTE